MKIRELRKRLKRIERKLGNVDVFFGDHYKDVPVHRIVVENTDMKRKYRYPLIINDDQPTL